MPTRWNPSWPESRKKEEREKRRRKYALKRLQAGLSYRRLVDTKPIPTNEEPSQEALDVLAQAARASKRRPT